MSTPPPRPASPEVVKDPRVLFAAERTLLAWIRTGLALMGFGFVVARFGLFLRELAVTLQPTAAGPPTRAPGLSLWLGMALVLLGVAVNGVAARQYLRALGRINRGESFFPAGPSPAILVALALAGIGLAVAFYLLVAAPR